MKHLTAIDDYTLAAYIGGNLPAIEHNAVTAFLDRNPDAHELMVMASQALQAARAFCERQVIPGRRTPQSRRNRAAAMPRDRQARRPVLKRLPLGL